MAHAYQDRYSSLVLQKLRKESIFQALFNTRYEGTPTAGAVKIPVRDGEVTVGSYSKTTGGSLSYGSTTYETLSINKDYYVNELIDGYEAQAVPDGIVADRIDSAGYSLGKQVDDDLAALCISDGTTDSNTTALTKSTVYEFIVDKVQQLKKLGVKPEEMWLAVTNDTMGLFLKCDQYVGKGSAYGDVVVQDGKVTRIAGVNVYETNNIADTTKVEFILGNSAFCHYVDEWAVPVAIKDLADGAHIGASALQGRRVAGSKITRPTTVIVKKHA